MSIQANFPNLKPTLLLDFANTKALDSRITYTRATTATYYDGKTTAKAEENLLTFSEQFDNAVWTVGGSTTTANAAIAPDGTTTADKLVSSATTGEQRIYRGAGVSTTASQVYTYSVYAKSDTVPFVIFRDDFGGYGDTSFNISAGTVGTVASGRTATITSVGNGWYRCSVTATASLATQQLMFCLASTDNGRTSFTGNGTSGVLLWGAQLEQRSFVTAYTPTTTAPITNYIPVLLTAASGTPRFDHNPITGESLGLLIEEQRTNLLTYSEQFDNAAWTKTSTAVTSNSTVAPDGTTTADTLVGTGSYPFIQGSVTYTAAAYTFSVFVKKSTGTFALAFSAAGAIDEVAFNLATGATTTAGANITSSGYVDQGLYWRVWAVSTRTAVISQPRIFAGYPTNVSPVVWGAQLEAGAFPTSYIPTVASQVTRAADNASMTGANFSSWFNQGESTMYAEASTNISSSSGFRNVFTIKQNSYLNSFGIRYLNNNFNAFTIVNDVTQFNPQIVVSSSSNKFIGTFKVNDFAASVNNGTVSTDVSGILPTVTSCEIGFFDSGGQLNGTIKKIAYYPLRLTNAQLQALTS